MWNQPRLEYRVFNSADMLHQLEALVPGCLVYLRVARDSRSWKVRLAKLDAAASSLEGCESQYYEVFAPIHDKHRMGRHSTLGHERVGLRCGQDPWISTQRTDTPRTYHGHLSRKGTSCLVESGTRIHNHKAFPRQAFFRYAQEGSVARRLHEGLSCKR